MKKIYFLFVLFAVSSAIAQNSDSLRINKALLLFHDSSDYMPVITQIPFNDLNYGSLSVYLEYQNIGSIAISGAHLEVEISHVMDLCSHPPPTGSFFSDTMFVNQILPGESDTLFYKIQPNISRWGNFEARFKIINSNAQVLDSALFAFKLTDTTYAKDRDVFHGFTGPTQYKDTNLNQYGGTVIGDRFATLYEVNNPNQLNYIYPSSVSFYVANDSNVIGAEISPTIWNLDIDSITGAVSFGSIAASSWVPYTIQANNQNGWLSLVFDNGPAVFSGFSKGKYAVGYTTISSLNGKNLVLAKDTIGAKDQVPGTTFIEFGHDPGSVYRINDLPGIRLALYNGLGRTNPCNPLAVKEFYNEESVQVYPNPSNGIFQLDSSEPIEGIQVTDMFGRSILEQNGSCTSVNLTGESKGLYLVKVKLKHGEYLQKLLLE